MRKSFIVLCMLLIAGLHAGEQYTLDQCLEIAVKNNPDMVISKQQVEVSQSQLAQAKGNFMPTVGAGVYSSYSAQGEREYMVGGVKQTQPATDSESYGAGIELSQTIL